MNCPKCNSAVKEGAKFCTSCGSPMNVNASAASPTCPKCAGALKPNAKFCTACGEKISENVASHPSGGETAPGKLSMVKQKLTWNIQPGEIARRVNETEFIQYESATGIIINEGTTAYIRANGKLLAEIHGGSYDFIDSQKIESLLEKRTGGLSEVFKKGGRFLINLILGKKVKDKIDDPDADIGQLDTLDKVVEHLKKDAVFSLTIKLDKPFQLLLGAVQDSKDAYSDFKPMIVKTKYLDANMGIRAFFKISDFQQFAEYYLGDRSYVTAATLTDQFTPLIRAVVQEEMYDVELTDSRIPQELVEKIRSKILAMSGELFYGVSIERVVEIVSNQQDLERFRELSKELYLSEKELDYLIRTNDFRNRLSTQENLQTIHEAGSALDLHKKLKEINKDQLIFDDDLEKFYMLLSREKTIREAKNENEIAIALAEIEKTELLREEDLDMIRLGIKERKDQREFSISFENLGNEIEYKRREWEKEDVDLEGMRRIRLGTVDVDVEEQRRREKARLEMETDARKTQIDLDDLEMKKQMEIMKQLKDMEQAQDDRKHSREMESRAQEMQHEKELEDIRLRELEMKYQNAKDLSPQQLMAVAVDEKLNPEVAIKLAESLSSSLNTEQQNNFMAEFTKLNQQRLDDVKTMSEDHANRMERMMHKMMETTSSMTGHLVQNKDEVKNEYKERLTRQEDRVDATQDKALDYTTRNNLQPPPQNQPVANVSFFVALPNLEEIPLTQQQINAMIQTGKIKPDTLISSSVSPSRKEAGRMTEFASMFGARSVKICKKCNVEVGASDRFCEICGGEV